MKSLKPGSNLPGIVIIILLTVFGCSRGDYHDRPSGSTIAWGWDGDGQVSNIPEGNDFIDVTCPPAEL